MRVRFLLMLWCLSACDGLPVAAGNAYPCDFSKSPGTRDEPCAAGDVCSINNVCVAYIYEGPRMEGGPRATQYMRDDFVLNSAVRIHPGSLDGPVLALARDVTRPQGALLVRTDTYAVQVSGTRLAVSSFPSEAPWSSKTPASPASSASSTTSWRTRASPPAASC